MGTSEAIAQLDSDLFTARPLIILSHNLNNMKLKLKDMTLIIVKAQVAALVRKVSEEQELQIGNITSDFMPILDRKVRHMVEEAVQRAKENKRKTLMGRDL